MLRDRDIAGPRAPSPPVFITDYTREPRGQRRPGIPRADTPHPALDDSADTAHTSATLPALPQGRDLLAAAGSLERQVPAGPNPLADDAGALKRDLAGRSPAAKADRAFHKRARTVSRQQSRSPPQDAVDVFREVRPASAMGWIPQAHSSPVPVDPANIPLPPSADTSYNRSADLDAFYAATDDEEEAAIPAAPTPWPILGPAQPARPAALGSRGGDLYTRPSADPTGSSDGPPRAALVPGSLAAQVAGTDDVLPTARDAFRYTPIPAAGPPPVNAASPRWLFQNLDVAQIVLWENLSGGKVFATIFGGGGADHLVDKSLFATVANIRSELVRLTGVASLRVTPPDPATRPTTLNAPPYGFLIHGLSVDDATRLLAMGFFSTPKVTILFFPFAVTYPTIMANFMFIADKSNEEVRRMVVSLLRRPENREKILDLVLLSGDPADTQRPHHTASAIIKSARVTSTPRSGKGGTPTPVFNLYIDTRASSIDVWKKWKAFFCDVHWHDADFGTLGLHDDVLCPGCRGADHYRWACPFMALPYWNGTMPPQGGRTAIVDTRGGSQRVNGAPSKKRGGR